MRIFNKRDILISVLFFTLVIVTRLPLVEHYQSHWDGPQYSIAIINYSIENQTPATPGYPLYIAIGKVFYLIVKDPHYALLLENVLVSAIGIVIVYWFGKLILNRTAGIIASLLYLTSPVIYFFGLTAYTYGVDIVFYLLFVISVYIIVLKKQNSGLFLGISYAVLLGTRPQDVIYTWPLFILGFIFLSNKEKAKAFLTFALICLSWFLPLINVVGSFNKYFNLVSPTTGNKLPPFSLYRAFEERSVLMKGLILTNGISFVFLIYYLFNIKVKKYINSIIFFSFWIIPPLLFNLFIRSDHAGYQLSYLLPLLLLSSVAIYQIFYKHIRIMYVVILFLCLFNLYLFFKDRDPGMVNAYVPTSFHYSEIRKNDIRMNAKIQYIKNHFNPARTIVLIGIPDSWRPVMYYLKDYKVYEFDNLTVEDGAYKGVHRYSYQWDSIESNDNNLVLSIPSKINSLVLYDDEASAWEKNFKCREIKLPGNSSICKANVQEGNRIKILYHKLKLF